MRKGHLFLVIVGCILLLALALPLTRTRAADAYWTGEYFANRSLIGPPAATRQDKVITFTFGYGPPMEGLPSNNFSIRWTKRDYFNAGPYMFAVSSDDGARMYVDGVRIIDDWVMHEWGQWRVAERQMTAGEHTIVVEYFEAEGWARIQAGYEPKYTPTPAATATRTPTPGPSPTPSKTPVPTLTFTPRPTRTPNIIGTVGAQPTAFQPPPTLVPTHAPPSGGGVETATPGPDQVIDESDVKLFTWTGFPGPAVASGGQDGSYVYVKNRSDKLTFEAFWNFIPTQSGYYDVYVYLPASTRATQSAVYQVLHSGESSADILIDQMAQPDAWVILGSFYFAGGQTGQYVHLSNQTSEETATRDVLMDAVMMIYKP